MIRINKTQLMKDILQVILASFIVYIEYMFFLKQNSLFVELLNHPSIVQYVKKTMVENIYLFRGFFVFINIIFLWIIGRVISIVREDIEMAWFTILLLGSFYFLKNPNPYVLVTINILFFLGLFIGKYKFGLPGDTASEGGTIDDGYNSASGTSISNSISVENDTIGAGGEISTGIMDTQGGDDTSSGNSIFDLPDDENQGGGIFDPEYQGYFVGDDMYYIGDLDNTILSALKFKLSSNNDL